MNTATSAATPAVVIEDLAVCAAGRTVLEGVNLRLERGSAHLLVGPSGSGKTTLLRAINRLNELFGGYRTTGRITVPWNGGALSVYGDVYPLEDLRRRVGMVFQNPNVLPVSIRRNFTIPLQEVLRCGGSEAEGRLERALTDVGLWEEVRGRLDEPAVRLSGGQQQRLCLARALALEPSVLLLDEPTANLDFRAAAAIENLIAQLKEQYVLLVVSHGLDQAVRLADRVAVLRGGRVVLDLPAARSLAPEEMRSLVTGIFAGD